MELLHGDCLELLKTLPAASVDSFVTDPPYGLKFMGKNWDACIPGVVFWEAALRYARWLKVLAPARSRLVKANIKYLSALIQQLVELRNEPERDEYGALRATKQAFDLACTLLIDAAIVSAVEDRQIPYGCVSTDSQGGIRVEWVRESASVHIIIPASEERDGYVYHEEAANYGTEPATAEALARWLRIIKD